jgi:hypothetical protein
MKVNKFQDSNSKNSFLMMEVEEIEYVNPIHYLIETLSLVASGTLNNHILFLEKNQLLQNEIVDKDLILSKAADDNCERYFTKILRQSLPQNLLNILESNSKNEQKKVMKNLSITSNQLMLFIIKAWEDYGFTYSFYTSKHNHNGVNNSDLPKFSVIEENGEIMKVGETQLKNGEIKHAINYKTLRIAKFIDKGKKWHCFFYDLKSIEGKEKGWQGKPHIHYISSNWGLTREQVLFQLKNKNYRLPSLPHINFART